MLLQYSAQIEKYGKNGEKTGWTFVLIPADLIKVISGGKKTAFRVKGKLDEIPVHQLAVIPVGAGDFILPLNAPLRKKLKKEKDDILYLQLEPDESEFMADSDFMVCLASENDLMKFYEGLTPGHQRYYSKWIESAKTSETKAKRIAQAMEGFRMKMGYPEMIRYFKGK